MTDNQQLHRFKISQYTGRGFDLTIEVEKDAEECRGLNVPKVIKVSRIIADEEGGQPEGETLPEEMFKVTPDRERYFRYAGELMHDLFNAMGGVRSLPGDMIISPRGPEAAAMLDESREELAKRGIKLDEERIDSMLAGEKRKKTGRNDPCPCGSGKKYKNCCGKR